MTIPKEVKSVIKDLQKTGFEAYIVGGCVRDFLLGIEPKDWDVTTNAKPEEIQKVFPGSFYKNDFFTVTILTGSKDPSLSEIEITTYRSEAKYSDKRHPDQVKYAKKLEDDLSRRDFTINAMALEIPKSKSQNPKIIDLFEGQKDLEKRIIRTVGNPEERFNEDALRTLRAVRFATTLEFKIEEKTKEAIKKNSIWLDAISKERIRDEFVKTIMSDNAAGGIELLRELGLLKCIMPELLENYGVAQNKHHIYDCYQHAVKSLEYATGKKFNMYVRLASLLHDIAKPRVKAGEKESTFYNHEILGARMTFQILNNLKFSRKDIEKITKLVRYHMFYYDVDQVGEASVRRLIKNVGPENIAELLQVRLADRIGSGVPKAEPYKLRHFKYLVEKVSKDPISVKMLKINGSDLMQLLAEKAGPRIGQILDALLGVVLDDPKKNNKKYLETEAKKFAKLPEKYLKELAERSKEEKTEVQEKENQVVKQKYWVK